MPNEEAQAQCSGNDLPSPHINTNTASGSSQSPSSIRGHDGASKDGIIAKVVNTLFHGLTLFQGDEVILEKVSAPSINGICLQGFPPYSSL